MLCKITTSYLWKCLAISTMLVPPIYKIQCYFGVKPVSFNIMQNTLPYLWEPSGAQTSSVCLSHPECSKCGETRIGIRRQSFPLIYILASFCWLSKQSNILSDDGYASQSYRRKSLLSAMRFQSGFRSSPSWNISCYYFLKILPVLWTIWTLRVKLFRSRLVLFQ